MKGFQEEEPERFLPLTRPGVENLLRQVKRNDDQLHLMPRKNVVEACEKIAQSYLWLLDAYVHQGETMLDFARAQGKSV